MKTVFALRQDIDFTEHRSFVLLNDFSEHNKFPDVATLYNSDDIDNSLSFFRYTNMMSERLGQGYIQCLDSMKSKWAKTLQANTSNIAFTVSNIDIGTLIVFDTSNGAAVITPNTCDHPQFSYAALVLKKSSEGKSHQLKSEDKLIVRGVRIKRLEHVYRISITFDRHKFVKSLDIITSENPENLLLRQLHFSTDEAISGGVFSVQPPKERYF